MAVDLEMEFRDGVSLRRQLEDALRVAIRSGRLPPGSALPPSRDLAEQLSVSRGVVVDSYAQLTTEGYLSARRGSGTRVAATAASGRPPARRQLPAPNAYRYELRPGWPISTLSRAPPGSRRCCVPCANCRTAG